MNTMTVLGLPASLFLSLNKNMFLLSPFLQPEVGGSRCLSGRPRSVWAPSRPRRSACTGRAQSAGVSEDLCLAGISPGGAGMDPHYRLRLREIALAFFVVSFHTSRRRSSIPAAVKLEKSTHLYYLPPLILRIRRP